MSTSLHESVGILRRFLNNEHEAVSMEELEALIEVVEHLESRDSFHTSLRSANEEIAKLNVRITELQERGSQLVLERQKITAFGGRPRRQRIVFGWVERVFGIAIARSVEERAARVVEEAIELAQACGVDKLKVIRLVDRVYSREVGRVEQEIGGVCITLLALGAALKVDVRSCETDELERILSLPEQVFGSKQSDKHAAGLGMAVMVP